MKPARKWKTTTPRIRKAIRKAEEQPKVKTPSDVQTRTTQGISMFGNAAQIVSETKSSLPVLLELPSYQKRIGTK